MRILFVEDHSDTRTAMTKLLQKWGHDVATADSLKAAIDQFDHEPFDAIVTDIALPDGTGYALISEARRRGRELLGIALSGYAYPAEVKIAKLTGFDHHLTKPCNCQHLRKLLEERINSRAPETGASVNK